MQFPNRTLLGTPSTLEKSFYRMPLSNAFLFDNVESVEQYQIRRLQNTFEKLQNQLVLPQRWRLLRYAKLSEERLKVGARYEWHLLKPAPLNKGLQQSG